MPYLQQFLCSNISKKIVFLMTFSAAISLQLFHRSHPWKYFCSHFLRASPLFLQPYSQTSFSAAISLQLFHRSHPWKYFCSHFPAAISSQSPLEIFLQPFPLCYFPFFCSHIPRPVFLQFPCSYFIAVIPGNISAAISFLLFSLSFLQHFHHDL